MFTSWKLLLILCWFSSLTYAAQVRIQGTVSHAPLDYLTCSVSSNDLWHPPLKVTIPLREGKFSHFFEVSATTFVSFSDGRNYFAGFIQPGDSLVIHYDYRDFDRSYSCRGPGKEKFELPNLINQIKRLAGQAVNGAKSHPYPVDVVFDQIDSLKSVVEQKMRQSLQALNPESYLQLQGFLEANVLRAKYNSLVALFGDSYEAILHKHSSKLSPRSVGEIRNLLQFDGSLDQSTFYVHMVENILSIYQEENNVPLGTPSTQESYRDLARRLPANLQSPVLFLRLSKDIALSKGTVNDSIFVNAAHLLSDHHLQQLVIDKVKESRLLRVGTKAPEFSVQNLAGHPVTLSSLKGKVVYLDFWFAGCGPCHQLFKALALVKKYFEADSRVVFLTVSIDAEKSWKQAVSRFKIDGYHVFTENKFRDHPIIRSYQVSYYPTTYLISPQGVIHSVTPASDAAELKQQILAILDENKK